MNPLSAMPNPLAEPAMPASTGPAEAGADSATGFADALHRASGGSEQARPEDGPHRAMRNGPGPDRETRAQAHPDDARAAAAGERDEAVREHAAAGETNEMGETRDKDDWEAAVGRKRSTSDEAQETGNPMGILAMTAPAAGAEPGTEPASDPLARTAGPAGGDAARARSAIAGARRTGAQDAEVAVSLHGQAKGEPAPAHSAGSAATDPRIATTAAGLAAQAAALPAAAGTDAAKPAGASLRRSTGVPPTAERGAHGAGAGAEGRAPRALVGDARSPGTDRAAPGSAATKDPAPALPQGDGGARQGFEDALLASLAQGNDPGAAIAPGSSASAAHAAAGGLRPIALPIAAPVHSAAFPQALGQQLAMALRMDLGQAELILSPAELGPVRVELSLDGDAASVHFAATNPETRQALEQSLPNLRALFAEQGLSLADTHVGAGFHRESDARATEPAQRLTTDRRAGASMDGEIRPMNARIRPDALVDLFA